MVHPCGGSHFIDSTLPSQCVFYSTDANYIDKFFFRFEPVIFRGSEDVNRPRKLILHLSGDALDFYFNTFVEGTKLTASASNYNEVNATLRKRFGKADTLPQRIRVAVNATLDENYFISLLRDMDMAF